jgi:hypothetical protein
MANEKWKMIYGKSSSKIPLWEASVRHAVPY